MTYGISIQNQDGRIQIDENYSSIYRATTKATASVGAAYPPTTLSNGDLVFARPKSNGHMSIAFLDPNQTQGDLFFGQTYNAIYTQPSSGYEYFIAKKTAGNITASGSGYGLEVYGPGSEVVFSATGVQNTLKVLATGKVHYTAGAGLANEDAFPTASTTYPDLTKIFCLIPDTMNFRYYIPPIGGIFGGTPSAALDVHVETGYRYEYTSGNAGRVWVNSKQYDNTSPGTEYAYNTPLNYLIVELIE